MYMTDTTCLLKRKQRKRPFSLRAVMAIIIMAFSSSGRHMLHMMLLASGGAKAYSPISRRALASRRIKHSFPTTSSSFCSYETGMRCLDSRHFLRNKAKNSRRQWWKQSSSSRLYSTNEDDTHSPKTLRDLTGFTVKEAMEYSLRFLQNASAPEPEMSVTQLLASALELPWSNGFVLLRDAMQCSRNYNKTLASRILTRTEAGRYREYLARRAKHEPLQYILGKWDFLDFTLKIQPPLLCPRPETEELVLLVVKDAAKLFHNAPLTVLDIGCGTGAIGISLAAMLPPHAHVTAIDIEPIAVQTSNENAKRILVKHDSNRYTAILSSAADFTTICSSSDTAARGFDVIVSNPPYIPQRDMATLTDHVVLYESRDALCGGEDGMNVIRDIIRNAHAWGHSGTVIWMEVDPTHPALIQQWFETNHEDDHIGRVQFVSTHTDLYGRDRFVKLVLR
jgi:release factor glutamine methyltransferase